MVFPMIPPAHDNKPASGTTGIARDADPLRLLCNILEVAGVMALQWGEEILLHLQVAALWSRIGRKEQAISYLTHLTSLHAVDAFRLGPYIVKHRIDLMQHLLDRIAGNDNAPDLLELVERKHHLKQAVDWMKVNVVRRFVPTLAITVSTLTSEERGMVDALVSPISTWLDRVRAMPLPPDCRGSLVSQVQAINEYADPRDIAHRVGMLFKDCRHWHERRLDTPVWVHDLDDVGPRVIYLAVCIGGPGLILEYLERCIEALREQPLALINSIPIAVGGLGLLACQYSRDDLLHRALDDLPRLPEHEECLGALALTEVLIESSYKRPERSAR